MTDSPPQYAPGDPVLVAAVVSVHDARRNEYVLRAATSGRVFQVRGDDPQSIAPTPPAPTPTGLKAAQEEQRLRDLLDPDREGSLEEWSVRAALAFLVYRGVTAPVAVGTDRLTTAAQVIRGAGPGILPWEVLNENARAPYLATAREVLVADDALRAEEAAAAAPATTDDDRVTEPFHGTEFEHEQRLRFLALAADDAHRAAGSPS